ncbi:hypothetical protein [Arhodomonas sp. AD133]|uniref:hypothetical protein n=1 Tax=Arhodomonas sp. AD133 TaxID=3415009 RepID=UPI003EBC3CA3
MPATRIIDPLPALKPTVEPKHGQSPARTIKNRDNNKRLRSFHNQLVINRFPWSIADPVNATGLFSVFSPYCLPIINLSRTETAWWFRYRSQRVAGPLTPEANATRCKKRATV